MTRVAAIICTLTVAALFRPGVLAQEPVRIKAFQGKPYSLAFSPDGKTLVATGPGERSALAWDAGSGKPLKHFPPAEGLSAAQALFSADGKSLWVRAWGQAAEAAAGIPGARNPPPPVPVRWTVLESFDFNTGKRTSSRDLGGVFLRMDLTADGKLAALRRHHYRVEKGGLVSDPRPGNDIILYDLEAKRERFTVETWKASAEAFVFTPDGKTLLLADKGGVVRLVDTKTGKDRGVLESLGPSGQSREFCLTKGFTLEELARSRMAIKGLSLSADGTLLTTSHDGFEWPQVFDLAAKSARPVRTQSLMHREPNPGRKPLRANLCVLSPDGKTLGCDGGGPGQFTLVDVATGEVRAMYDTGKGPVQLIAFSPDSKRAAVAKFDGTIQVWPVPAADK